MHVNWSKAPEGTTHYVLSREAAVPSGWYRADGNKMRNIFLEGEYMFRLDDLHPGRLLKLFERPPVWTGEGLPSVGVMCEYLTLDCGEYWCKASVSYVGTHWVLVGYEHPTEGISEAGVNHVLLNGNLSSRLRPLLTPEQIAARERKEIEEDIQRVCVAGENNGVAYYKALYDAGFRRQVKS